ncbi:MAG: type III secretion system chaperone [Chlamydiia bacterium]|nr:type III secretion system chaperone [Chlamydiia bacterium]
MNFDIVIQKLNKVYQLGLAEGHDLYSFVVNEQYQVFLERSPDHHKILLFAPIGSPEEGKKEGWYQYALEKNLYSNQVHPVIVAIDPKSGQLVQYLWFHLSTLHFAEFLEDLRMFSKELEEWKELLKHEVPPKQERPFQKMIHPGEKA